MTPVNTARVTMASVATVVNVTDVQPSAEDLAADGAVGVEEAARWIGIGRTGVYALMGRGDLRWAKVGGRRVIPRVALRHYLAAQIRKVGEP